MSDSEAIDFLKQKFEELLMGAELCIHAKLISPALVLVYSGIDVAGGLYASDPAAQVGARFTDWATRYLLPAAAPEFEASAQDLYGARCGLLHNFSSESNQSRRGDARKVQYAWGDSSASTLIEMAKVAELEKQHTAIQVEELIAAFRKGLVRFFDDAAADSEIAQRLATRSNKVLGPMSEDDGQELLRWGKALRGD
jgi:hypothetical protein